MKYKNCVCDGNVFVRMWTTAQEDEDVLKGNQNSSGCIFSLDSVFHHPLRSITSGEWREPTKPLELEESNTTLTISETMCVELEGTEAARGASDPSQKNPAIDETLQAVSDQPVQEVQTTYDHTKEDPPLIANSGGDGGVEITKSLHDHIQNAPASSSSIHAIKIDHKPTGKRGAYATSKKTHDTLDSEYGRPYEPSHSDASSSIAHQSCDSDEGPSFSSRGSTLASKETPKSARQLSRPLPLRLSLPTACKNFIVRESAMEWLNSLIIHKTTDQKGKELDVQVPSVGVLYGPGGIGKTQIALHFAHSVGPQLANVFWVNSMSHQSILQSFHDFAIALRLVNGRQEHDHKRSAALCLNWLAKSEGQWLCIFDNVDESAAIIEPYIPRSNRGLVIITTRDPRLEFPKPIAPVYYQVPTLSHQEAEEFLSQSLDSKPIDQDSGTVDELIKALDGLPLAITQAAALMTITPLDVSQFLSEYRSYSKPKRRYSHATTIVWGINQLSADAKQVLAILAYTDPDDTKISLLQDTFQRSIAPYGSESVDDRCLAAIEQLKSWSLCLYDRDRVRTHRIVRTEIRHISTLETERCTLKALTSALGAQWPSHRKFRNVLHGFWPDFDDLLGQCRSVADFLNNLDLDNTSLQKSYRNHLSEAIDESFPRTVLQCLWYVIYPNIGSKVRDLTFVGMTRESAEISATTLES
jgi:hypothetical protein